MFIKFVHYPEDKSKESVSESVFECDSYQFTYSSSVKDGGAFILYKSNVSQQERDYLTLPPVNIILPLTSVYIMSDSGKTVDSYRWTKTEDGAIKRM